MLRTMARPFTGSTYNCKECGVSFRRSRCEVKRGRIHYCSHECSGKAHSGKNNPQYKRGWFLNSNGYKKIRVGDAYKYEHRHLKEQELGRILLPNEDVHHLDGNKLNNSLDNLVVLSKTAHAKLHGNWVGEKNHTTKLTVEKVKEIRQKHQQGAKSKELAKEYLVDISNIRYIVNRVTWKHI